MKTTPTSVKRLLEHGREALLVAEDDERVIGALVAGWDGWRGNMYRLAVLPKYRRGGVARTLVEAGHARLRSLGARRITALVAREDAEARALWRALGYECDEQVIRFVNNL